MTGTLWAGALLIAGAVVFLVGAAIGVPRVFLVTDPQERLRMLTARLGLWRSAQPLYGLGAILSAAGVGVLAAVAEAPGARVVLWGSCAVMTLGALAWCRSLFLRGTRVADFAAGSLPGWPFTTYALSTIGGLLLLGAGLFGAGLPAWLGWCDLAATLAFLVGFLWAKDIPPFLFYLLLGVVGVVLVVRPV